MGTRWSMGEPSGAVGTRSMRIGPRAVGFLDATTGGEADAALRAELARACLARGVDPDDGVAVAARPVPGDDSYAVAFHHPDGTSHEPGFRVLGVASSDEGVVLVLDDRSPHRGSA